MYRLRLWAWGLIFLLFCSGLAWAEEVELLKGERFQGGPWRLRAEQVTYDAGQHVYEAQGRVELRQGDRRLSADRVQVNEVTKIAVLEGQVVLVAGDDVFTGQRGHFNLATHNGEMHGARLFVKRNHFHVDSPVIRKTGEHSYFAESAVVTTCDTDRPVWSFSTRQLSVVLEGYATSRHSFFKVGGLPVLYFPYTVLPVRTTRQSGFLMPNFGQHRAGGTVFELPFYWAIDNHSDATLYQTLITRRGYMQGVELRHKGYQDASATFRFAYLDDGYDQVPTNRRYWVAGMMTQPLGQDWNVRSTVDRVSDANYLKDFNFGYLGLNRYSKDLLQGYGRDLEAEEVNVRVSNLLVSRNFSWGNLTGYGRYYQKLRNQDPTPYQRLPGVSLQTIPLPTGSLPFRVGLGTSYVHFYQDHGQSGQRLDLHPQIWWQGQPLSWLNFDARGGVRETIFRIDQNIPGGPPDTYLTRQLYDAKVSVASAWVRDYGRDGGGTKFYRHILRPEVTYWNMPLYQPRRYPGFDPFDWGWRDGTSKNLPVRSGDDPLGGVNAVTYGFSNNLLWRGENDQGQAVVNDVLWFRFSQSIFFTSSSMGLNGYFYRQNRVSDFLGETEYYPFRQLKLGLDLGASPYKQGFNRSDFKMTVYDQKRHHYLSVGYLYLKDYANQVYVETYLDLFRSVKTWLTHSNTLMTNNKLESRYGVILQRQCWGVALSYTERPDDKRFGFTIFIPELGEKVKKAPMRFPDEK